MKNHMADGRHFLDLTKEEQEDQNAYDINEIKHWLGGWAELRKLIDQLEENENEAAYKRHCTDY